MSLSKKQLLRNSGWTLLELVLYPLLMIIATPIFISRLGIEQYGLWSLVSTITIGMNFLNIGVGDTNVRFISRYRAERDNGKILKLVNYNFTVSVCLFLVSIITGLIFYYSNFISVFYKADDYSFANKILLLACASAGIKFIEIALVSVFKGFERFDMSSRLILLSKNSVMIVNLLMVLMGYDLVYIFISTVLLNAANIVVQLIVVRGFQSDLLRWPIFNLIGMNFEQSRYNFWYWLQSTVALMGFIADKLLVAYLTDVKTLGYYSIASLIGTNIHNFFLSFGSFIFPRVSYKLAEKREISDLYFIARTFVVLPGWTLILMLLIFGSSIFRLWLGANTFDNSITYINLYLIFEAGMLLIIVPFYFINASSQIKLNSIFELLIRVSHFAGMLVGYHFAGTLGIIYGLIAATLINIPFQYFLFHKQILINIRKLEFLWAVIPVFLMTCLVIFGNVIFQVSLIAFLILFCKAIYYDPAKKYSGGLLAFTGLFRSAS